jgi:hypothetical protein
MRILLASAVLSSLAVAAMGQEFPKVEVFGGYSYGNFQILKSHSSLNGWNASATVNIYRWFGLTTDFGGLYGGTASETVPNSPAIGGTTTVHEKEKLHTILFGPQFSYRVGRISSFAHVLIGDARITTGFSSTCNSCGGSVFLGTPIFVGLRSPSTLATSLGLGLDYGFKNNLAWRTQADYLQYGTTDNVRISTGLVFQVGK